MTNILHSNLTSITCASEWDSNIDSKSKHVQYTCITCELRLTQNMPCMTLVYNICNHRKPECYVWKLDLTENFSRMRMKLSHSCSNSRYTDASHLRDTSSILFENAPPQEKDDVMLLAKVTSKKDSLSEDEGSVLNSFFNVIFNITSEDFLSDENPLSTNYENEKLFKCDLIMLNECIPGRLDITTQHLSFFPDHQEKKDLLACRLR